MTESSWKGASNPLQGTLYSLDRDSVLGANVEVPQYEWIKLVDRCKVDAFIPKELNHAQLTHYPGSLSRLIGDQESVDTTTKNLHGLREFARRRKGNQGFFPTQGLDLAQCYRLPFLCFADDCVGSFDLFVFRFC